MKKIIPSIIIWRLTLTHKDYEDLPEYYYFLTEGGVRRFLKRHEAEIQDEFTWSWGGIQLWLW